MGCKRNLCCFDFSISLNHYIKVFFQNSLLITLVSIPQGSHMKINADPAISSLFLLFLSSPTIPHPSLKFHLLFLKCSYERSHKTSHHWYCYVVMERAYLYQYQSTPGTEWINFSNINLFSFFFLAVVCLVNVESSCVKLDSSTGFKNCSSIFQG